MSRKRGAASKEMEKKANASGDAPQMLVDNPSKWKSWWVRVNLSVVMIVGFGVIIWMGHFGMAALVLGLQIAGYRELLKVREKTSEAKYASIDHSLSQNIIDVGLFVFVQYLQYGMIMMNQFPAFFQSTPVLETLSRYHLLICASGLVSLLVFFVLSLEKDFYKHQFLNLSWNVVTLVAIFPSNLHIINIMNGIAWFLLPVSLIVCNDCTAYIWGFFFGRTPLIGLSPKKTWEGFIGAFFSTVGFAFLMAAFLGSFDYFCCPKLSIFSAAAECVSPSVFAASPQQLPVFITDLLKMIGLNWEYINVSTFQIYALWYGVFASTIAPFGGFVASGFKRGYEIKDFGDLIPGHGGIVDRMDCEVMMAAFSYVFYMSFVYAGPTVSSLLQSINQLSAEDKLSLIASLH